MNQPINNDEEYRLIWNLHHFWNKGWFVLFIATTVALW